MDRRQFISSMGCGLLSLGLAGCGVKYTSDDDSYGKQMKPAAPSPYERGKLIIAEGTEPNALIEKGLNAIGGIGKLVKPGSTVVIKPNFSVPRRPEEAATTNPLLVAAVVKQCLAAGAKEVKVIDYPFNSPPVCLASSGIMQAVESVGGRAFTIDEQSFFTRVDVGGKILRTAEFSKDVLAADVFINFPLLKHHSITKLTMGLKNMMGLVWDRGFFHRSDLNRAIAELATFRKPQLTILDATRGIIDNGPMGPGTIRQYNQVIFGVDPVAVDAYGTILFGLNPAEIDHLSIADELGLGEMELQKLTVVKV